MNTILRATCVFAASISLFVQADEPAKIDLRKLPPAVAGKIDFIRDIQPIFSASCLECHGPSKQRAGLRLDVGKAALEGGDSGVILVPGSLTKSRLLHMVAGLDAESVMPPKGKTPLTRDAIAKLRTWIEQGAPWPATSPAAVARTTTDHWAFQPLRRPAVPPINTTEAVSPIDHFIRARLEKERLAPSAEADRVTLIRRLSFDLLGLPPTPEEVSHFVSDTRPDAYRQLVERLLASPHYGERWGRHWLDLARYADSDGYEQDRPRLYAFRYRDWVIRAISRDQPFDQFTIEQLAGDLLPGATIEQKAATGFHRNTLTNREGGTDKEQFRVEACIDRVNTTFKVYFGLTMGCAQCHDHKYDPISQREYYRLFAFFNSDDEIDLPSPLPDDVKVFDKVNAAYLKKKADVTNALAKYKQDLSGKVSKWEAGLKAEERKALPEPIARIVSLASGQRSAKDRDALVEYLAKGDAKVAEFTKMLTDLDRKPPVKAFVPTLAVGKGRKTHVLIRGDFLRPGAGVESGTPEVLHPLKTASAKANRLDLAKWIVSPENPLTARVIVNWAWQKYFGRGLVATLEDFGTQGEKPSHPELLDWLASEFHRQQWSLKALHRTIVTSATYRQSSQGRPELGQRDPLNILLARQNRLRLEAEVLRDNALAVSGLLHPIVGGPSVKPPQPPGISELTYANGARWVESQGADRYRRGLYTWFQRTSPYPLLAMFDAPDGTLCCVRRERTNTPLQALSLLNDATFVECAQNLARRIVTEQRGSTEDRLTYAFRLVVGRAPRAEEMSALRELHSDLEQLAQASPKGRDRLTGPLPAGTRAEEMAAWVGVGRMLMNLDEFVTRE